MRRVSSGRPAPDERLVMPECGYEIVGGEVFAVSPAHEPHGSRHSKLLALLEAYVGDGFNAACDMLTRTGEREDFAPDGSIYPLARDPETGGRQLEVLAFEVVSTERLTHAGKKAASLVRRGVRRVFAIDVEHERGLEWSIATDGWEILGADAVIDDEVFVMPLRVHDLVSAGRADDGVARALLARGNPVVTEALRTRHAEGKAEGRAEGKAEGRAEGKAEGRAEAIADAILLVLAARDVPPTAEQRARILGTHDIATLTRWLDAVARGDDLADALA